MPTKNLREIEPKRKGRAPSASASESDSNSDDGKQTDPVGSRGSSLEGSHATLMMWIGLLLLILFLNWAYMIPYMTRWVHHEKLLRSGYNVKLITPSCVSAIPLLYKDITYNATKKEGDIFRGRLDTFPGNTLLTFNRYINEMPDYPQGRQFPKLFEDVQADADEIYHEYMAYYDLVRRHTEDAMLLTNAVIEDLNELISDVGLVKTSNFKKRIINRFYWRYLSKKPIRSRLIRQIFIEYLKGLQKGYVLPQSNSHLKKSVGLHEVIETGNELLPKFEEVKDASRALRFTVEFGIYKVLTDQNLTNPAFVPRSEILRMLPFITRSNSRAGRGHDNDTIGYMTYWLDNEFAAGENVREVEMPNSVRQFQQALVDITKQVSELVYDFSDEKNGIQELSSTVCYIDKLEKALRDLAFHHNFDSIFPGHPNRPRAIWKVHKCIWERENRGSLKETTHCGKLEALIKEKVH
ncbi:hypothetical protein ACHAO8_009130 [Botrytis cinerea]